MPEQKLQQVLSSALRTPKGLCVLQDRSASGSTQDRSTTICLVDSAHHCLRLVSLIEEPSSHNNSLRRDRVRLDAANGRWYGYGQISGDQISEAPQRALIGSPIRSPNGTNAGIARAIDDAEQEEHWEEQRWPSSAVDAMRMLERENLSLVQENKRLRGLLALAADRIEQQGAEIGRMGLGA